MEKGGISKYRKTFSKFDSNSDNTPLAGILALEDKFEYLYDVNFESGEYTLFTNEQTSYGGIRRNNVGYTDFFEDSRKNIEEVVFPEDRDLARKVLSRDYLRAHLKKEQFVEYLSRVYVDEKPLWFRTRIAYKNSRKRNVIVGVFNVEEEIVVRKKDRKLRNELIDQMMGGESVYLINPKTDELTVIYRNKYLTETYGDSEKYSQSITKYINSDVYKSDRDNMIKVTRLSSLCSRLGKEKEIEEMYRDVSSGLPYWYKMRAVKISETEILMGFSNVDKEYLDNVIHKRIEEEFFGMFAADLEQKQIKVLKTSSLTEMAKLGDSLPYSKTIKYIASKYEGETRTFFDRISDIRYVREELSKEEGISYTYKSGDKWITTDILVLSRNEKGVVTVFAFGFRLADYHVAEREELQAKLNASRIVVEALSEDFGCVNYVKLESGRESDIDISYRVSETLKRLIPGWECETNFSEKIRLLRENVVLEDDREQFYEDVKRETLIKVLKDSDVYYANFRAVIDDSVKYYQMKATAVREDGKLTGIVVGFHSVDEPVRIELAIQEQLQNALEGAKEEAKRRELEATNSKLRADALAFLTEQNQNPSEFLDFFTERMLNVFNCDQVVFRNILGEKIVRNAPGMENVSVDSDGQVKSSIVQQVYTEGELSGLITLRYLKEEHEFSYAELDMIKNIAGYLGILIGRIEARQKLTEENVFTSFFLESYMSAYYINLSDLTWHSYKRSKELADKYPVYEDYTKSLRQYINTEIHPDDRKMAYILLKPSQLRKKLLKRTSFSFIIRKVSEKKERVIQCEVVRGEDKNHIALGFLDITESIRKQEEYEEALRKALVEAQAASRAKTDFLNNMSHDIRTPLNAIMGLANMAKKRVDDRNAMLDYLDKIIESGNVLLNLINSVLEVGRIESGNAVLEEQYADAYLSFESIKSIMLEMAEAKGVKLEFEFGTITDRYLLVDISKATRVLVNVISNAIKYTPKGGNVKVRCEQLGMAKKDIVRLCYTITDNGIGMSEEFQKHIYDHFARERDATLSGIQGTGLGMAVCKSLVELMGGSIDFSSKQCEGTTFKIILPFKLQHDEKYTDPVTGEVTSRHEEKREITPIVFNHERILLAEDNEINREIVRAILEEEGLIVEEAENGAEAVELLKEKGKDYYDIILMDIQMPVLNGYEATKAIRMMYPDKHIPIIAVTANAFVEDKMASMEACMDGHISKPINIREMLATMKNCL